MSDGMRQRTNAKKKFDDRVNAHKQITDENRQKIFRDIPQIKELLADRNQVWIDGLKESLDEEQISLKLQSIDDTIDRLLKENGYQRNMLEYRPLCEQCDDQGYINGQICRCYKQLIIDEIYTQSNLSEILQRENFDTFDESVFGSEPSLKNGSVKDNILQIRNKCESYIDAFDRSDQNLIFAGAVGTGKTFLAHCVAKALMDKGKTVIYFTAYDLIEKFTDIAFGNVEKASMNLLWDADLLIIDDLGCERQTDFAQNLLFNMINERILRNKRMLIVTNLSTKELQQTYDERIFSRLMGAFAGFRFRGEDLRIKKRKN